MQPQPGTHDAAVPPCVSVVLPTYNGLRHLAATVDSVLAQDFQDFELVLVDDGSTDSTAEFVRSRYGNCPRVRLVVRANGGIAAARNTALEHARGRFIAFLDHDDIWHPQKLTVQVRWLDELPEDVGCVFGEFRHWDGDGDPAFPGPLVYPPVSVPALSGWVYHQLLLTNWVLFSTAMLRREVFATVGNFDPDLPPADDWDMAIRVSRRFRMMKCAEVVALYRQHPAQTSRRVTPLDPQTRLRESMILRYGPTGPDGSQCDKRLLRERRVAAHTSFASSHALAGRLRSAMRAEARALASSPLDRRAWTTLIAVVYYTLRRFPSRVMTHMRARWQ
jgi:hypothetical protein